MAGTKQTGTVTTVNVASQSDMQHEMARAATQGFTVSAQFPDSITMIKRPTLVWSLKEILLTILLLCLCLVPGFIYMVMVYKGHAKLETIIIRVDPVAAAAEAAARPAVSKAIATSETTWSPDRKYWYDGTSWIDADQTPPPSAKYSDDRAHWWDGASWRPAPATTAAAQSFSPPVLAQETSNVAPAPATLDGETPL